MKPHPLLLKFFASVAVSTLIIMTGHSDLDYLFTLNFLFDLVLTFLCVFLVLEYVDRITRWLDTRYTWRSEFYQRLILQVFYGLMVPIALTLILTWLQFHFIYGYRLTETSFLVVELPLILLILIITNLVYIILYLFRTDKQEPSLTPSTILARRGQRNYPVPHTDVMMIRLHKVPCLYTLAGDELLLAENMDYYENELPAHLFFRANRQVIISRQGCASYRSAENGKVRVELIRREAGPVIVSQRRASRFRSWIRNTA